MWSNPSLYLSALLLVGVMASENTLASDYPDSETDVTAICKRARQDFKLGRNQAAKRPRDETLKLLTRSAKNGYLPAQDVLLRILRPNIVKNDKPSFELAKFLSDIGNTKAHLYLGNLYTSSILGYVPKDEKKAFEYFTLGAMQGDPECLHELGIAYMSGRGVEKEVDKGVEYLKKAVKKGHSGAGNKLFCLAFDFENGIDVIKNFTKTMELYTFLAEEGYDRAQYELALIYDTGIKAPQDLGKAFDLYTKAAEKNVQARFSLGRGYLTGKFGIKDIAKGTQLLDSACEDNLCTAHNPLFLSKIYEHGMFEVPINGSKAQYFHLKALNLPNYEYAKRFWYDCRNRVTTQDDDSSSADESGSEPED
jgi:TPR repeat protein